MLHFSFSNVYFPEYNPSTDPRHLVRVDGRGLLLTNSAHVEFLDDARRQLFPLVPATAATGVLAPGLAWLVPFELRGFVLLDAGSLYNLAMTDAYQRLDYSPDRAALLPLGGSALAAAAPAVAAALPFGSVTTFDYAGTESLKGVDIHVFYCKLVACGTQGTSISQPGFTNERNDVSLSTNYGTIVSITDADLVACGGLSAVLAWDPHTSYQLAAYGFSPYIGTKYTF